MKKARNIGLILGLIILISSNSNAQYYYTSTGYAQEWRLPQFVQHSIYDNYYGYEIAHVQRYNRHGHRNFNVLLHRNGWYVELRLDRYGHIYKTVRHNNYYPLRHHNCSNHCGYHRTYYASYYPKYHHGHKKTVYINSNHGHNKHYKNHGKGNKYYTNIHIEKQKKQNKNHGSYNGNTSSRKSQQNYNNNNQQRRQSTTIRKPPQHTSNKSVEHKRPQQNNRSQATNGQSRSSRSGRSATASRSGRGS